LTAQLDQIQNENNESLLQQVEASPVTLLVPGVNCAPSRCTLLKEEQYDWNQPLGKRSRAQVSSEVEKLKEVAVNSTNVKGDDDLNSDSGEEGEGEGEEENTRSNSSCSGSSNGENNPGKSNSSNSSNSNLEFRALYNNREMGRLGLGAKRPASAKVVGNAATAHATARQQ